MYKLFTHNDLDGIGCACVLKHVVDVLSFKYRLSNTSQVDVSYLSYDNVNSVIQQFINDKEYENYTLIFITDISVDEETAKLIDKTIGDKVVLLDHHQHLEWLDEYPWATVSPFKYKPFENEASSGTYLLWDYLRYPANSKISKSRFRRQIIRRRGRPPRRGQHLRRERRPSRRSASGRRPGR